MTIAFERYVYELVAASVANDVDGHFFISLTMAGNFMDMRQILARQLDGKLVFCTTKWLAYDGRGWKLDAEDMTSIVGQMYNQYLDYSCQTIANFIPTLPVKYVAIHQCLQKMLREYETLRPTLDIVERMKQQLKISLEDPSFLDYRQRRRPPVRGIYTLEKKRKLNDNVQLESYIRKV